MDEYCILITVVDNRLSVQLNEKLIYDSGITYEKRVFDPPKEVRIDHLLNQKEESVLTFSFYNGSVSAENHSEPNSYSFSYRIVKRIADGSGGFTEVDVITPYSVTSSSKPNITLPSKKYTVKPGEQGYSFELKTI